MLEKDEKNHRPFTLELLPWADMPKSPYISPLYGASNTLFAPPKSRSTTPKGVLECPQLVFSLARCKKGSFANRTVALVGRYGSARFYSGYVSNGKKPALFQTGSCPTVGANPEVPW